jgi:hypothetical protein
MGRKEMVEWPVWDGRVVWVGAGLLWIGVVAKVMVGDWVGKWAAKSGLKLEKRRILRSSSRLSRNLHNIPARSIR